MIADDIEELIDIKLKLQSAEQAKEAHYWRLRGTVAYDDLVEEIAELEARIVEVRGNINCNYNVEERER